MNMNQAGTRTFVDNTLSKIKSWPSSRRLYEFWKPTYKRHGAIVLQRLEGVFELPPELKRCLLTLGESSINKVIYLISPSQSSELDDLVVFGHIFDGRLLAFSPDSESPENIYLLAKKTNEHKILADSIAPLLAMTDQGFKREVRRGSFS